MKKIKKATMVRMEEADLQAILTIRKYYGVTSDNQAIILAINVVARQIEAGAGRRVRPQRPFTPEASSQGHSGPSG